MSLIRCGGPSAVRTRTAAKRAFSGPLCRCASSQFATWHRPTCLRPPSTAYQEYAAYRDDPRGFGPDQLHPDRIDLEVTRDANCPGKVASHKRLAERRAHPVSGIRQHAAEAHTSRHHTIDLSQRDLWLGSRLFDARLERPPASIAPDRSSNSREEKDATRPSPALRRAPASATPASGSWRSCQAPKHIAEPRQPSACPSSASRCRR